MELAELLHCRGQKEQCNYEGGTCMCGGAGVELVCGPLYVAVWFCEGKCARVISRVCVSVVWCVCQICKEPLICCLEFVNNWNLLW